MKKSGLFLTFALVLSFIFSGCAAPSTDVPVEEPSGKVEVKEELKDEDEALEPKEETAPIEEPTKEERGMALKVVFLVPGSIDSPNYSEAYAGLQRIEQIYGSKIGFVEMGENQDEWSNFFETELGQDWDIIVSDNNASDVISTYAGQHPDKRFVVLHEFQGEVPENVFSLGYKMNEAAFLAGACAASVTVSDMPLSNKEPIIGFIGGMNIPVINNFLAGYIEGAMYVNQDIKVLVDYAENFGDLELGKSLAQEQYDKGADIIYNVAGFTGQGIFEAAKQSNRYAIGVDVDQAAFIEKDDQQKADLILTSVIRKHENALFWAIDMHLDQMLEYGSVGMVGISEGAVGIVKNKYYETLDESVKTLIETIEGEIAAGQITVSSGFDMDSAQLSSLIESVKP